MPGMDVFVDEKRFRLVGETQRDGREAFAEDVRAGLTSYPKSIPPQYFYDDEGSRLFEEICGLPEYYLTRTEARILRACGPELVRRLGADPELVELGSGSAEKTRILLEAFLEAHGRLRFIPIDIAGEMLAASSRKLLEEFEGLEVVAILGDYVNALRELIRMDRASRTGSRRLVLWLGSSIGNLTRREAAAFLRTVHDVLEPGDGMLIGVDHRKDKQMLEAAYDDAQGVTARFNRNLLVRIDRELGGQFDSAGFEHRAAYDVEDGRVDMFLVSTRAQAVDVDALSLRVEFEAGETIHTESSYKYSREEIEVLARESSFRLDRSWSDENDRFSLNLFLC